MNIPENILSTLTDEQKKKVEAAQTREDLLDIAKEAGRELTMAQLESVSGGETVIPCPRSDLSGGFGTPGKLSSGQFSVENGRKPRRVAPIEVSGNAANRGNEK